jgi:hypothetical protein
MFSKFLVNSPDWSRLHLVQLSPIQIWGQQWELIAAKTIRSPVLNPAVISVAIMIHSFGIIIIFMKMM